MTLKELYGKKKDEGFTIIEVMIVLAIAGLIILIVFLAVPALQRNSRNTQRKNDVGALLGAVNEYVSNNNGKLPTTVAQVTANAQLGFYDSATEVTITKLASGTKSPTNNSTADVVTSAVCSGGVATFTGASSRNVVVLYRTEGSGGYTDTCVQS